jgi:hypothetical protein
MEQGISSSSTSSRSQRTIRQNLPLLRLMTADLGECRAIQFCGVGRAGWDQYDVHRERGTSRWQILLSADGKIASASLDWDRPR